MKILNNQRETLFKVGDKYKGSIIIKEISCASKESCREVYKNFEICGGSKYKLSPPIYENEDSQGACLFQVCKETRDALEERKGENHW